MWSHNTHTNLYHLTTHFFLKENRKILAPQGACINIIEEFGIKPKQIIEHIVNLAGGYNQVGFTEKDLHNYIGTHQ